MLEAVFEAALAEYESTADARRARNSDILALFAELRAEVDTDVRELWASEACEVLDAVEDVIARHEGPVEAAATVRTLLTCLPERPLRRVDVPAWVSIARMSGSAGIGHAVTLYRDDLLHSPSSLQLACDQIKSARLDPVELLTLTIAHRLDETQLRGVVTVIVRRQRHPH